MKVGDIVKVTDGKYKGEQGQVTWIGDFTCDVKFTDGKSAFKFIEHLHIITESDLIPDTTRRESHEAVKQSKNKRYMQILEILSDKPMTAREVAEWMFAKGYTATNEPNNSRPRLTELCDMDRVRPSGTKLDPISNKNVTVYKRI